METKATEITASMVTVEVTDEKTGIKCRRELPIDFLETANCLKLKGEGLNGEPAELVFYSNRGIDRLKNLIGQGPDEDSCGSHT